MTRILALRMYTDYNYFNDCLMIWKDQIGELRKGNYDGVSWEENGEIVYKYVPVNYILQMINSRSIPGRQARNGNTWYPIPVIDMYRG